MALTEKISTKTKLNFFFRKSKNSAKQLIVDLWNQLRDSEIQLVASSLSYSTALSIIPFLVVSLTTFQAIGGLDELYPKVEAMILFYLKETNGVEVAQFVKKAITKTQLNTVGLAGVMLLVLTSMKLLHDMEAAINRVWGTRKSRPLFQRIFGYWIFMITFPTALAAYAGVRSIAVVKPIARKIPQEFFDFGIVLAGLFIIYKFVPVHRVRTRAAFLSATLASLMVVTAADSFRALALGFFNYSKIYGSLAAIPLALLWILVMWYIVLLGVAICASTHRDSQIA